MLRRARHCLLGAAAVSARSSFVLEFDLVQPVLKVEHTKIARFIRSQTLHTCNMSLKKEEFVCEAGQKKFNFRK